MTVIAYRTATVKTRSHKYCTRYRVPYILHFLYLLFHLGQHFLVLFNNGLQFLDLWTNMGKNFKLYSCKLNICVVDPDLLNPDPAFQVNPDPDPGSTGTADIFLISFFDKKSSNLLIPRPPSIKVVLWIRIHFFRIRIRIQSLPLETNTDPGL